MTARDAVRVVFFVFFVMLLRVKEIHADGEQMCSCASEDDGRCDANQLCDPGGNCNKENVAYGKEATISTRNSGGEGLSGPACAAVNGRTGDVMKYVNGSGTNCVHTSVNDNSPWWQVDLGQNYTVTNITIYSRQGQVERLAGIQITIDDKECKTLPPDTSSYSLIHTTACDTPRRGQVVKLSKVGITNPQRIINFCEVQIWVCRPGLFGQNCDQTCHCHSNVTCDNYSGICPNGCMDGYYGPSCSEMCGQCVRGDGCNGTNGNCPDGCKAGYQPPLCNKSCENKTYGDNCREQCGRCENSAACHVFNGSCQACEGKFALPLCKECVDGYFGADCSVECGQCSDNAVCDKTTGYCPGVCQPGYELPLCKQECQNKTYGENCREQCGRCENSAACDVFNGSCQACDGNYSIPLCTECMDGYYGNECRERCGQCADNDVCGKVTGHCPNGCPAGYQPPYCNTTCEANRYGKDCKEQCGQCSNSIPCDFFNGTCEACMDGFSLPMCKVSEQNQENPDQDSNQGGVIGGAIGAVAVVVAAVVIVVLVVRRKRKQKERSSGSPPTSLQSEHRRDIYEHPSTSLQATNYEEQPAVEMTTSTETNVDVTVGERGDYDSLQYGTDDRSPYDTPVFAKQRDVYENADLDKKDNTYML